MGNLKQETNLLLEKDRARFVRHSADTSV